MPFFGELTRGDAHMICEAVGLKPRLERSEKRNEQLEKALVALINAIDARDKKATDDALSVGRGLTF